MGFGFQVSGFGVWGLAVRVGGLSCLGAWLRMKDLRRKKEGDLACRIIHKNKSMRSNLYMTFHDPKQ